MGLPSLSESIIDIVSDLVTSFLCVPGHHQVSDRPLVRSYKIRKHGI